MTTRTHGADQIHTVRGGYYFKDEVDMLYFFPTKGKKQLLQIYTSAKDWAEVRKEK